MLTIDGSAGGGQVVRTALACSALTGEAVRIEHVRDARPEPGLKAQHVAACDALAAVCDADVDGVDQGSETVTFEPDAPQAGEYGVDVGTAGAVTLVCDAVLPVAAALDAPLSLTVTGGTDVKWAPAVDYYRHAKLPLLARCGLDASLAVERRGFYPAGGGRVTLRVEPTAPSRRSALDLRGRGPLDRVNVHSVASESLADAEVADRQAAAATEALGEDGTPTEATVEYVDSRSPGSALVLAAEYGTGDGQSTRAGFTSLGERGLPSEAVAERAVEAFRAFDDGPGAVDEHAADQCMLPLALWGGAVWIPRVTDHVRTNRDVLAAFGADVAVEERDAGALLTGEGRLGP